MIPTNRQMDRPKFAIHGAIPLEWLKILVRRSPPSSIIRKGVSDAVRLSDIQIAKLHYKTLRKITRT